MNTFWKVFLIASISSVLTLLVLFLPFIPASAQTPTVTLTWTAPGDDWDVGTAASYQMRWKSTRPDTTNIDTMDTWWNGANVASGLPVPKIAGTPQSYTFTGPSTPGATYYFVLKACDEVPNCSAYSNVASATYPVATDNSQPRRIIDLVVKFN